jgi:hypothetical protein
VKRSSLGGGFELRSWNCRGTYYHRVNRPHSELKDIDQCPRIISSTHGLYRRPSYLFKVLRVHIQVFQALT